MDGNDTIVPMQEAFLGPLEDSSMKSADLDQRESENCLLGVFRVYKSVGTHSLLYPVTYRAWQLSVFPSSSRLKGFSSFPTQSISIVTNPANRVPGRNRMKSSLSHSTFSWNQINVNTLEGGDEAGLLTMKQLQGLSRFGSPFFPSATQL